MIRNSRSVIFIGSCPNPSFTTATGQPRLVHYLSITYINYLRCCARLCAIMERPSQTCLLPHMQRFWRGPICADVFLRCKFSAIRPDGVPLQSRFVNTSTLSIFAAALLLFAVTAPGQTDCADG